MAISLKGRLADKAQELLGGRNITEKRVESLLEELAESRAKVAALEALRDSMPAPDVEVAQNRPRIPQDGDLGGMTVPNLAQGFVDGGEDDESPDVGTGEEDPAVLARQAEVPFVVEGPPPGAVLRMAEPAAKPPENATPQELLMFEMLQTMKAMREEMATLRQPPTKEEADKAMAGGKLPPPTAQAPPGGYTGQAAMPRGVWFKSPFTPPQIGDVKIKLCACPQCRPSRMHHYYCVVCRRGPLPYIGQTGPKGRKLYTAPGGTWGVAHECCTITCWHRYLETMGVVAGVNDSEPPGMDAADSQPAMARDSD